MGRDKMLGNLESNTTFEHQEPISADLGAALEAESSPLLSYCQPSATGPATDSSGVLDRTRSSQDSTGSQEPLPDSAVNGRSKFAQHSRKIPLSFAWQCRENRHP
jgi:hypothetical protein